MKKVIYVKAEKANNSENLCGNCGSPLCLTCLMREDRGNLVEEEIYDNWFCGECGRFEFGKDKALSRYEIQFEDPSHREKYLSRKDQWVSVGKVGVDSGSLMVIDPSYIFSETLRDRVRERIDLNLFSRCIEQVLEIPFPNGGAGLGVVSQAGYGDGLYNVSVKYGETPMGKRVTALKVEFITETIE